MENNFLTKPSMITFRDLLFVQAVTELANISEAKSFTSPQFKEYVISNYQKEFSDLSEVDRSYFHLFLDKLVNLNYLSKDESNKSHVYFINENTQELKNIMTNYLKYTVAQLNDAGESIYSFQANFDKRYKLETLTTEELTVFLCKVLDIFTSRDQRVLFHPEVLDDERINLRRANRAKAAKLNNKDKLSH